MSKILFLLPVAGLLAVGPALAAETYGGVVTNVNPSAGTVSVQGAGTFAVSQPSLLRGVWGGEHVIVTKNDNGSIGLQEDSSYSDGGGQTSQ
ncbi:hypothetical protein ACFPP9_16010 [Kaistia terrae]|uniref:DUF5666 domain-containing protein n=2 Tax=Kaistia terrae TaxID=537017 RepID=A0ABW0PXH4_9HYPH